MAKPNGNPVSSLNAALAALGLEKDQPRQPGEFTIEEACIETGLSRQWTQERLNKHLSNGKVTRRKVNEDGRAKFLWRVVKS